MFSGPSTIRAFPSDAGLRKLALRIVAGAAILQIFSKHRLAALLDLIGSLCGSAWVVNYTAEPDAAEVHDRKALFRFAWPDRQYVMRKWQLPCATRN